MADAGGPYTAVAGDTVLLDGSASYDIDGDALSYSWSISSRPAGSTAVLDTTDPVKPTFDVDMIGFYEIQLVVNDSTVNSTPDTITVEVADAVNSPPLAVGDFATVVRNSAATFIDLTGNDSDPDGNLKTAGTVAASQITITTGAKTTRGGSVSEVTNGVIYTPKRNFRGTDTFNYTVADLDGAVSNEVTVRVNVVRP